MAPQQRQQEEETLWAESNERKLLFDDITSGFIPAGMKPKAAQQLRDKYKAMRNKLFASCLCSLQEQINKSNRVLSDNYSAYNNSCALYPKQQVELTGLPQWEGLDAERFLRVDLDKYKAQKMKPKQLYESCNEYKVFTLERFCKHIYQEDKHRKFIAQRTAHHQN